MYKHQKSNLDIFWVVVFSFFVFNLVIFVRDAASSCFSFIPYGYNGKYSHLPSEQDFCYFFGGKKIYMQTSGQGGRYISTGALNNITAFGESQLLGMDWSDRNEIHPHDLTRILKNENIIIFAAPNNGPLQSYNQIKFLIQNKTIKSDDIIIGFNFGTDIFRVDPLWDPDNFIPLTSTDLVRIFKIPFYHDLMLAAARIQGKYFGSNVSNSKSIRKHYFSKNFSHRLTHVLTWLSRLKELQKTVSNKFKIIIFPPYWYLGSENAEKKNIEANYQTLICSIHKSNVFDVIYISKLNFNSFDMAYDERHFKTGALDIVISDTCQR